MLYSVSVQKYELLDYIACRLDADLTKHALPDCPLAQHQRASRLAAVSGVDDVLQVRVDQQLARVETERSQGGDSFLESRNAPGQLHKLAEVFDAAVVYSVRQQVSSKPVGGF